MTLSSVSLVFEGLVAGLLVVMIFFAIKLNKRLTLLREREADMQRMIDRFDQAAARAEASAAHLKQIGGDAEKSLRSCIDGAQAVRDDLAFMIERASGSGQRLEQTPPAEPRSFQTPPRSGQASPRVTHPASDETGDLDFADDDLADPDADVGSRSERDLVKAILSAQSEQDGT